jgi:hypothetical protein
VTLLAKLVSFASNVVRFSGNHGCCRDVIFGVDVVELV